MKLQYSTTAELSLLLATLTLHYLGLYREQYTETSNICIGDPPTSIWQSNRNSEPIESKYYIASYAEEKSRLLQKI